jgi:hypothetical protein
MWPFGATRSSWKVCWPCAVAVMLTGDGGGRRIDAKVTDPIRARGIPVVGFSTPTFFATGDGRYEEIGNAIVDALEQ